MSLQTPMLGSTMNSMKPKGKVINFQALECKTSALTNLALGDEGVFAVAQRAERQTQFRFSFALQKELLE